MSVLGSFSRHSAQKGVALEFVTLRVLMDRTELHLDLVSADADLTVPVRWIAFTELLDPTPYLNGGELVLTSGKAIPVHDPHETDMYIDRLIAAGAIALGFGVDRVHDEVPRAITAACHRVRLPLISIPSSTSFATIGRAVTEMVAAAERTAVQRPYDAQRRLLACARRPDGTTAVVDELAVLLKGSAALLDPTGNIVHSTPAVDDRFIASARKHVAALRPKGLAASATFDVDELQAALHPVGMNGAPRSYLATGWPEKTRILSRTVVPTALTLTTLLAEQENVARSISTKVHDHVARLVLQSKTDAASAVADVAELLTGSPIDRTRIRVVLAKSEMLDRVSEDLDLSGCYSTSTESEFIVLMPVSTSYQLLSDTLAATGAAVGISRDLRFEDAAVGVEQARRAAGPLGQVRTYDELMRKDVSALVDGELIRAWSRELLAPLVADSGELVETLRAYLSNHGLAQPTATQLGTHRHTVRSRITKVETLLGLSLGSPEDRSNVLIALNHLNK
ncbi:PucR family transcriptional regulator [Rhodococcoides kyotonense]|uniref:Purine catabolism regulatory protein n=1 Tax=Rhodococcoides kyotonense TaxID=398843 RepID=A0A239MZJ8_9NOCA|nr:PucR family transcriptional regulator [Rhodococcus kyotonensis]SNT48055.1 purine catabolism regulatory protein [Rhodococcus kyotonensis]